MFIRFYNNQLPRRCDLPTGAGKTSIAAIWLLALARQAAEGPPSLPRRLVYVVNRRTVVDQATVEVEKLAARLAEAAADPRSGLKDVAEALESLRAFPAAGPSAPMYVSTLRGQRADNGLWKRDPAALALIIGTVDMVGSRLLFSGYGDGKYFRPLHAGLLGIDTMIVHDEAHLTPAFGHLLEQVKQLQSQFAGMLQGAKPMVVVELSATLSGAHGEVFRLSQADYDDGVLVKRLRPPGGKRLRLSEVSSDNVDNRIVELATQHEQEGVPVVIFLSTVGMAKRVRAGLEKRLGKPAVIERVRLLTGILRGQERDSLAVSDNIFRRFLLSSGESFASHKETCYLIATAAGEVGVDIDAAHGVCDLSSLTSMVQRLGRINRSGNWIGTTVDAVYSLKDDRSGDKADLAQKEREATLKGLRNLPFLDDGSRNASPEALASLAFTDINTPGLLPLTHNVLEVWSLTSLTHDETGAPPAECYLHGLTEKELPRVSVAWRADLSWLLEDGKEGGSDALKAFPLRVREVLQDVRWRVNDELKKIVKRSAEAHGVLIKQDGSVHRLKLSDVIFQGGPPPYSTVVLPAEVGGLSHGMMDGASRDVVEDVSAEPKGRVAVRILRNNGVWTVRGNGLPGWVAESLNGWEEEGALSDAVESLVEKLGLPCVLAVPIENIATAETGGGEDPGRAVVYLVSRATRSDDDEGRPKYHGAGIQTLSEHSGRAEQSIQALAGKLSLDPCILSACTFAAKAHDRGKERQAWQKAINNLTNVPLAKSKYWGFNSSFTMGYRHEFGSLLDVMAEAVWRQLEEGDLALHLIAAHHGHARPGFEESAFDRAQRYDANKETAREVSMAFVRLQRRFGWWALAWLEALIKAADYNGPQKSDKKRGGPKQRWGSGSGTRVTSRSRWSWKFSKRKKVSASCRVSM
ncbi:MAG: type I-U CRISPR-associated helicase/endonuclease Cas3, partial [Peptococcaceae bacterium]|nr:type I-U CRISPR-associated helicase/endonuclease Cas3 [Peptococcaceae bacterium]